MTVVSTRRIPEGSWFGLADKPLRGQFLKIELLLHAVENGIVKLAFTVKPQEFHPSGSDRFEHHGKMLAFGSDQATSRVVESCGGTNTMTILLQKPWMPFRPGFVPT